MFTYLYQNAIVLENIRQNDTFSEGQLSFELTFTTSFANKVVACLDKDKFEMRPQNKYVFHLLQMIIICCKNTCY